MSQGTALCRHVHRLSHSIQASMLEAAQSEIEMPLTNVLPQCLSGSPAEASCSKALEMQVFSIQSISKAGTSCSLCPRKMRSIQVSGRVSPGCLAGSPAAWVPGPRRPPHCCGAHAEGRRKETMQDRISPSPACNLPGSNHLISKLLC